MEADKLKAIWAEFERQLATLTTDKAKIVSLTKFALQYKAYAEYIAKQILVRAKKADPRELAPFYLIDSITKAGSPECLMHFTPYLVDVFVSAFEYGTKETKRGLLRMYKTWDYFYPPEVLQAISRRLRLPDIEKLLLTPEDYERIEMFKKQRVQHPPSLASSMPLYRPPPVVTQPQPSIYPPAVSGGLPPHLMYSVQHPLIPTTAPPPPPQVPTYPNVQPMRPAPYMPSMHPKSAQPSISPSDGAFAIVTKKFRAYVDRVSYVPISLSNPASLYQRNEVVLHSLYDETLFQCKLCGMKHDKLQALREHLDKHFLMAKTDKLPKAMAQTRPSFQPKDVWVMGIEREEYRETQQIHLIPYQESLKNCYACHYPFDVVYSQKEKGWVFTNAFEVALEEDEEGRKNEGEVILMHKACLKGFMIAQKEETNIGGETQGNEEEDELEEMEQIQQQQQYLYQNLV
eukprot:TRINITY_DN120401_c2_g1_i1.p2 TRINITY_DN120401_c2_g1~~TRINITY_DN120401_c2_g1_i1.p2  ORF type:complete len:490 (+),score=36.62 TRINITY_DN120401_c2_g1_i1:95-1471(+)